MNTLLWSLCEVVCFATICPPVPPCYEVVIMLPMVVGG